MEPGTIVNRSVLLVRVKEPMRKWLLRVFPEDPAPSLSEINEDCSAYLVPETDEEDERAILRIAFTAIFECELAEWCTDPNSWPDTRDRKLFDKWFDCQFHHVVTDLAPGLIGPWQA
jgi:hypothetical protein